MNKEKYSISRLAKRALPYIFYALLIIFLLAYLKNIDFSKLSDINIAFSFLVAALLVDIFVHYEMSYIWLSMLRGLGARQFDSKPELVYVYAKSWLGRYIPGTAPWILGKIYFASQYGISKSKLAVSSLLEAALQIIVMVAFSLFALVLDPRLDSISPNIKLGLLVLLVVCLVFLIPGVFNWFISVAHRVIKRKKLSTEHHASTGVISKGVFLYLTISLLNGIVFFLIVRSVSPEVGLDNLFYIIATANLSGALGMLAIFVPSGLGVREGIQIVLLSLVMPAELALIAVVLARLLSVVADLIFFGSSRLALSFTRK